MSTDQAGVAPASSGAIHDIGYRRYDGPRLGRRELVAALYAESLRSAFGLGRPTRSKIAPFVLVGLLTLPALVYAFVVSLTGVVPVAFDKYVFTFQPMVMIFIATQAPVLVARDLRFRVMPLYLSRPISRTDYVHAKLAAMASALLIVFAIPLTVQLAGTLLAELDPLEQLREWALAIVGAVLYALVLGAIGVLVASLAPRRGLGVAAIVAVLLVLSGTVLTLYGIGDSAGNELLQTWSSLASPFTLVATTMAGAFDTVSPLGDRPEGMAAIGFAIAYVAIVAALYGLLQLRYRKVAVA